MNVTIEKVQTPLQWYVDANDLCYLRAGIQRHKHPEAFMKAGSVEWCGLQVHLFHVWLEYPNGRIIDTGQAVWEWRLKNLGIDSINALTYIPGGTHQDCFDLTKQTCKWGYVTDFSKIDEYTKQYLSMLEAGERLYREARKILNQESAKHYISYEINKMYE